jgi:rubrerythrin
MLTGAGFKEVYNISGGMKAWQGLTAAGPAEMGMGQITGRETTPEILVISYGMEEGLRLFYEKIKKGMEDVEVGELLSKLAGVERMHKEKLFKLYLEYNHEIKTVEQFEKKVVSDVMEGGFTVDEFIEKNRQSVEDTQGVLTVAMMLESQALDLYLRYSMKVDDENTKKALFQIAQEEKVHLGSLGQLIEKKL